MTVTKGTTPTILFHLQIETDLISKCEVYLAQPELLIIKNKDDCVLSGNTIAVPLSQKETLQMSIKSPLEMQIRFVFTNGSIGATRVVKGDVERILREAEINV